MILTSRVLSRGPNSTPSMLRTLSPDLMLEPAATPSCQSSLLMSLPCHPDTNRFFEFTYLYYLFNVHLPIYTFGLYLSFTVHFLGSQCLTICVTYCEIVDTLYCTARLLFFVSVLLYSNLLTSYATSTPLTLYMTHYLH